MSVDMSQLTPSQKRTLLAQRLAMAPREHRVPTSSAQRRLWFLDQLVPGGSAYTIPSVARLRGPLDLERWQRCVELIVSRHEALRTTFADVDGQPVQVVHDHLPPQFDVTDCRPTPADEVEETVRRLAQAEFRRPFDLAVGPLLRVRFLRFAPDEHVLLMSTHHIVADLWSMSLAMGELAEAYAAYSVGADPDLAAVPIQFGDYCRWEDTHQHSSSLATSEDYWASTLAGAPAALDLPTDRHRPPLQTSNGDSCRFALDAETMGDLKGLAAHEAATPFMAVLAAFAVLMQRLTGESDVVLGAPVAGRSRPEVERAIGFFVNTLPLRCDLSGEPTFREVLRRTRQVSLGAFAHQDLPFDRVVDLVKPPRDLSRTPLFQVSFMYQNIVMPDLDLAGLTLTPLFVPSVTSRFDLELQAFDLGSGLSGWFEFNRDLFDRESVEAFSDYLTALITWVTRHPDQPVGEAPLLSAHENLRIATLWNATDVDFADTSLTLDRIRQQAATHPDEPAVRHRGTTLSYGDLIARSERFVDLLREAGVRPGDIVGLHLDRSCDMVATLLAIWHVGAAYLPLDPNFPAARLEHMVRDSGTRLILTSADLAPGLAWAQVAVLVTDMAQESGVGVSPLARLEPTDLAYVLYTSGSTGLPKGVCVPHRALDNFLRSMARCPGIASGDRLVAVTTLSFDIAMLELFLPLCEGAEVVIADRDDTADGARLARLIDEVEATVVQATPSTWRMVLDAGWAGRPQLRVLVGGEALPVELAAELRSRSSAVWNMYGPTETTIWSSVASVTQGEITLGSPIANTVLHVLEPSGLLAPPGVDGELCIGGAGLAHGYLGRADLTAARFVDHAVVPGRPLRLYHTGDQVARRRDGSLIFRGRLDAQVKLRGFRIELGEIEAALETDPEVSQAVVVVREDRVGQRLIAYVVPVADAAPDERATMWRAIWDAAYTAPGLDAEPREPTFDCSGWVSSYDGAPVPAEDMREWVAGTRAQILAGRPRSVLDVGCGTGLILFATAPDVPRYLGFDTSAAAVNRVRTAIATGVCSHARVEQRAAQDIVGLPTETFDCVVISSVVQYLGSIEELLQVIDHLLPRVAPGGRILLADLRSLPLRPTFHRRVAVRRGSAESAVATIAARRLAGDTELSVDPRLAAALLGRYPRLAAARVRPRPGRHANEMTDFRFDMELRFDSAQAITVSAEPFDWVAGNWSIDRVRDHLAGTGAGGTWAWTGIPNARIDPADPAGVHPDDLGAIVVDGMITQVDWSRHTETGQLTLLASQALSGQEWLTLPADTGSVTAWHAYANTGSAAASAGLAGRLKSALAQRLPDYMIPSAFVQLPALPLTPNGKVDRRALPEFDLRRDTVADREFVSPRTAVETVVAAIWQEVLGIEGVGIRDSFFDLGGHSLASTRVVARLQDVFSVELSLRDVFSNPTVADTAAAVERADGDPQRVERTARILLEISDLTNGE